MSAPGMLSPLEEARKKISKDELREGLKLVEEALGELGMEESVRRGYQNTVVMFSARYNRIQKERSIRTPEYYDMQLNGLAMDVLELIKLVEEELSKGSKVAPFELSDITSLVEFVVDIDFGERREEDLEEFLTRMATMIRINPGSLTAINKKARGIIVEGTLSTEHILKIKSLVRIGLLKGLESIKGYGVKEEWMKERVGVYFVDCKLPGVQLAGVDLSKADLSKADLSGADLSGANFVGAKLNGADLSFVNLTEANLDGADLSEVSLIHTTLIRANLRGTQLSGAILIGVNLKQANMRWANLTRAKFGIFNANQADAAMHNSIIKLEQKEADLSRADLRGADLSLANLNMANLTLANLSDANLSDSELVWTRLNGAKMINVNLSGANLKGAKMILTVFHYLQKKVLKEKKIDVSNILFVDDDGKLFRQ